MSLFSILTKKLGESVARFEPTQITDDLHPSLDAGTVFVGSFTKLIPVGIIRVTNGQIHAPTVSPNLLFHIPTADSISTATVKFESTEIRNLKVVLDVPEMESVQLCLKAPVGDDLYEPLTKTRVTKNLYEIRFSEFSETEISDNLFTPLLPHGVNGKNYQKKVETQQPSFLGGAAKVKIDGFAKAYTRQKGVGSSSSYQTQSMSIWDLLYPVLMPPINLDFGQQFELFGTLYPFQPAGIDFLMKNESALLADEMGTGKTVMSAVALKLLFRLGFVTKALIVCPVSLLRTWKDHLQDWTDELQLTVVRGTPEVRKLDWKYPAHVYLATYDTVASDFLSKIKKEHRFDCPKCEQNVYLGSQIVVEDSEISTYTCPHCHFALNDYLLANLPKKKSIVDAQILNSFDVVLIDEAQYVKNKSSQRSRAVRLLKPNFRWALSGTPIENRLDDLVSIFSFIKPELFKNENYLTPRRASDLIKPHFLRRMKKDVMKYLPPKVK